MELESRRRELTLVVHHNFFISGQSLFSILHCYDVTKSDDTCEDINIHASTENHLSSSLEASDNLHLSHALGLVSGMMIMMILLCGNIINDLRPRTK